MCAALPLLSLFSLMEYTYNNNNNNRSFTNKHKITAQFLTVNTNAVMMSSLTCALQFQHCALPPMPVSECKCSVLG